MLRNRIGLVLLTLLVPGLAAAHGEGTSLVHYLTSPDHVMVMLFSAALTLGLVAAARKLRKQQ